MIIFSFSAEMSLWGYGCHCVFLGDRPMSEMGHGHPVDELDKSCRNYKGLGLKNFIIIS